MRHRALFDSAAGGLYRPRLVRNLGILVVAAALIGGFHSLWFPSDHHRSSIQRVGCARPEHAIPGPPAITVRPYPVSFTPKYERIMIALDPCPVPSSGRRLRVRLAGQAPGTMQSPW